MANQDYHDAMVEAANDAIEQGRIILATANNGKVEFVSHPNVVEKPKTLGDLLREAMKRSL